MCTAMPPTPRTPRPRRRLPTLSWRWLAAGLVAGYVIWMSIPASATPLVEHRWRAWVACVENAWEREYQVGRSSAIKPQPWECTHAQKNVLTETLRAWGWWDRGDRGPAPDPEYRWDLYYLDRRFEEFIGE